jgi:hypothetical protein
MSKDSFNEQNPPSFNIETHEEGAQNKPKFQINWVRGDQYGEVDSA